MPDSRSRSPAGPRAPLAALALLVAASPAVASPMSGAWVTSDCPPRLAPAAVHDAARSRLLVFGGFDGTFRSDSWALSLAGSPTWTLVAASGPAPSPRSGHTAVLDAAHGRLVVFGGQSDTGLLGDAWSLDLESGAPWARLEALGPGPGARSDHAAVLDTRRRAMIVFGGWSSPERFLADVWMLTLDDPPAWAQVQVAGTPPTPRKDAAAIYDADLDRVVVFGGVDTAYRNDVWALEMDPVPRWLPLAPYDTPPSPRRDAAAVHDAEGRRMLVFGGMDPGYRNDLWALDLEAIPKWKLLSATGTLPAKRSYHAVAHDVAGRRMLVFGGYNGAYAHDAWALTLAGEPTWTRLAPMGDAPSARLEHAAAIDPLRRRWIVFGGYDGAWRHDAWALGLDTGTWTQLQPAGTPPPARIRHTLVHDAARDRMLLYGGQGPEAYLGDVWSLFLAGAGAWEPMAPAAGPGPGARSDHAAVCDPVRDRMLVHGGRDGTTLRDTWALHLGGTPAWSWVADAPVGRSEHAAVYDPAGDRLLVLAGWDDALGAVSDVWELPLAGAAAWRELAVASLQPEPRTNPSAAFDVARRRVLVFAGYDRFSPYLRDTWVLDLAGAPAWQALPATGPLPGPRAYHVAGFDEVTGRLHVFGGGGARFGDTWRLEIGGAPPSDAAGARARLAATVNPVVTTTALVFELGAPARVRLDVFDMAGRRLRSLLDADLLPGPYRIAWDGRSAGGARVASGAYVCRIVAGTWTDVRQLVVVH